MDVKYANVKQKNTKIFYLEASRGRGAQGVTVNGTGCRFNSHSRIRNI